MFITLFKKNFAWLIKLKIITLFFCLALIITAVQLLPFLELIRLTPRFQQNYQWATEGSLTFWDLAKFALPKFAWLFTGWVDFSAKANVGYLGVVSLPLLFLGFWQKEKQLKAIQIIAVFSVILALGRNTPFYFLFYKIIPGLSLLKVPSQIIGLYSFFGALLVGAGLDFLRENIQGFQITKKTIEKLVFLLKWFCFLLVFVILFYFKHLIFWANLFKSYKLAVFFLNFLLAVLILSLFFLAVGFFKLKQKLAGLTLILSLVMLDGFLTTQTVLVTAPLSALQTQKLPLPDFDKALYRIYTILPEQKPPTQVFSPLIERTFAQQKSYLLVPNQNIYQKYQSIDGYASMALANYINQFTQAAQTVTGLSRFDLAKIDLTKAAVAVVISEKEIKTLNQPRPRFFLEQGGEVVLLEETPIELNLAVESNIDQKLIRLDNFYPGWRAFVDNQAVIVLPFEKVYQSISMPAGFHLVTFKFLPKTFFYGSILSFTGIVLTLILAIFLWSKKFHV